ncbi:MAG: ribonuclease Z [bacterium]
MEIVLLGTSAALPTPLRRPAATALVRGGELLLFDCGEGTQSQLQLAGLKPSRLSKIFISHFHGDHFYGLVGLLTSLQLNGRTKPLQLFGPVGLDSYLEFMKKLSHFNLGYEVFIHECNKKTPATVWDMKDYLIKAMPLKHSLFVLGFRVEEKPLPGKFDATEAARLGIPHGPERGRLLRGETIVLADGREVKPVQVVGPERAGKKVAICLDTRPCRNAVELSRGVDLLVHEGTFDDDHTDLARSTGHATVGQAATVAREAGATRLVITHISQRYEKSDEALLLQQARAIFANTTIGCDSMRFEV